MSIEDWADLVGLPPEKRDLLAYLLKQEGIQVSDEQVIKPRTGEGLPPLSFAQKRLWFLDQLDPGSFTYNVPVAFRLKGRLRAPVLEHTLNEIVRRHEILRTTFTSIEEQPVQVISPSLILPLPVVDVDSSGPEPEAQAQQRVIEESHRPFDLARGPLLRALLLRLAPEDHILVLNMHHIISDVWSVDILLREMTTLYSAFVSGQASPLVDLPIQYADFAAWQEKWLSGQELENQVAFWKRQLGGELPVLNILTDHRRPPIPSSRGAVLSFALSRQETDALKALSQQQGCTLFMTMLAAFVTLLHRYTGQTDISVGSPIANRNRAEVEGLIGFFVNTLVLRADLSGDPTFLELLGRIRQVTLNAYAHPDVPFEKLVEELQPVRDMSRNPLFQVMFTLQNNPVPVLEWPELTLELLQSDDAIVQFDLILSMVDTPAGLKGRLEYSIDLFDDDTMASWIEHFQMLTRSIAAHPDTRLSSIAMLTEAERRRLLVDWNDTRVDVPENICLHHLFEAQAARTPDAIAVVCADADDHLAGTVCLTFHELDRRADQLARYLRAWNIGPESLVGILMDRSPEMIIAFLGVLKAGGGYVPLDPALPPERLAFILQDIQTPVLLTQSWLAHQLSQGTANVVRLDLEWPQIMGAGCASLDNGAMPANIAYAIYTSGSTGRPKSVLVPHHALVNHSLAVARCYGLEADDRVLQFASPGFDIAAEELYPSWAVGAAVVLRPGQLSASISAFLRWVEQESLTVLNLPAPYWHEWVSGLAPGRAQPPDSVRLMIVGSDLVLPECWARWRQCVREQIRLYNAYGPTEATITATIYEPSTDCQSRLIYAVPIGRPIANVQTFLLDPHGQLAPAGTPGELYIGGAGVARGYLDQPDLTALAFVPDPFNCEPGARLYKTGDLARYLPDGNIEFLGRADQQIKIRGYRIELGEIESVLLEHPAVREAAVLPSAPGRPDQAQGPGERDQRLVAYVVQTPGQAVAAQELHHFLRERLPDYMVPSLFVMLAALPRTPSGKVNRRALPIPDWSAVEPGATGTPRNLIEEMLATIWMQVLRLEGVSIHANFFELGGHSLLGMQIISRVRETLHVDLPLRSLFESPTIAGLAVCIESALRSQQRLQIPDLKPVPRQGDLELSFAQQRLWFLDQLEPGSANYNVPAAYRLIGKLNVPALEKSLIEIVRRHESLRTVFVAMGDHPAQVIISPQSETIASLLRIVDLRKAAPAEREGEMLRLAAQDARQPFDLCRGPLLRATLLCLDDQEHVLLLCMHHIISDDWSHGVFIREWSTLYTALAAGRSVSLPPLPIQYADFAAWQRAWLQGEFLEAQLAYWRRQLDGAPAILELPTDRPRPAVQSQRGAIHSFALTPQLTALIETRSQQAGATLFMTLLAAFKALLSRYTGQTDIAVGIPVANRNHPQVEQLVGFFVNMLVLRTDLAGNPTFLELLDRVRKVAVEAYAHQDVPFEKLVEELRPERNLSHTPLFQVMFAFQNAPSEALELPDLRLENVVLHSDTSKFDLTLMMTQAGQELVGAVEYNTDLFDASTIGRMVAHFQILLEGMAADPEIRLARLPLLTKAEQDQILVEWNDTQKECLHDQGIHELFEAQAQQMQDAVALVFEDEQLTYGELNRRANRLAHHLHRLGVGPEVPVGICAERSLEMIVGVLGVLKAGGAYVPLDPILPQERLGFILQDTQARILLTQQRLAASLPHPTHVICLDAQWMNEELESDHGLYSSVRPENPAYIIYTSGSTGRPKGVVVEHRQIVNYLYGILDRMQLAPEASYATVSTLAADLGNTVIFSSLCTGGCLHVIAQDTIFDPKALDAYFQQHLIDCLKIVPTHLAGLQTAWPSAACMPRRLLILGGEASPVDWIRNLQAAAPGCDILNHYGPTETTIGVLTYRVNSSEPWQGLASLPLGRPLSNTRVYVLDADLQPVPVGVPGELYIGGAGLARGYLNRPDLTAEHFIPDPLSGKSGQRLYATGDRARYRADGTLEFLGRADNQIKIRGYRVELGEVESAMSQHPAVSECVVVDRENEGSFGDKRLIAYVVLAPSLDATAHDLRQYLQGRLADYMLPSTFVILSALPLTPNGKVDRQALRALEPDKSNLEQAAAGPRTLTEELLAGLWAQVFKLAQVSVHSNFFDLGGHSLLATQVVSRVRQIFQVDLAVRALFESPTIAGLAQRIDAARTVASRLPPPIQPVGREGNLALSFAQQRLWFLDQLEPNSAFYNLGGTVRLTGPLDVAALERSLSEVVRRHEILRTSFDSVGGQPVQVIAPALHLDIPILDLQHLPPAERETVAARWLAEEASRPFDLSKLPLLRARLARLAADEHLLALTMHHIVADGWSMSVLLHEVSLFYQAFTSGETPRLPDLPVQYADFAAWQRQWLQGSVLEAQLAYWRRQLAGIPVLLELPTDRPRPALQTFRGDTYEFQIPRALADDLRLLSRQEGVTLFMTLLAAVQTLLYRHAGQDNIPVGIPIANRNHAEIESMIGFFVNTLVLNADFSSHPSFRQLLAQVREAALGAYAHQDLPFEKLVEELQPERNLSNSPLFQVMFAFQNLPSSELELTNLTMRPVRVKTPTAQFDLSLSIVENPDGLMCALEYSTDLFDADRIRRMADHFQALLEGIAAGPQRRVTELPLLTAREQHQLLVEWNSVKLSREYDSDACVHHLVETQAAQAPDAVAVVSGEHYLTYGELNNRANRLAHYLRTLGARSETLVGVLMERSLGMVIGVLGILKAGSAYMPLDRDHPPERRAFMIEDSHVSMLLTQASLVSSLPPDLPIVCLDSDWSRIEQAGDENLVGTVAPASLAYMIYTSGSTGQPKGVMIQHCSLVDAYRGWEQAYDLQSVRSHLQMASFTFDVFAGDLVRALGSGGKLVLCPREWLLEPHRLYELIDQQKIECAEFVPAVLRLLIQYLEKSAQRLDSMRVLVCGSDSWYVEEYTRFARFCGSATRLINSFGLTEATVDSTYFESTHLDRAPDRTVPIGRPLAGTRLYILSPHLELMPVGVPGELYIGGAGLARGYHGRPDLTADRFGPDPFSCVTGSRLYRTGDLACYLVDGNIEFLGRADAQVKIRGFRIELGEIEAVLSQHPAVREAVVIVWNPETEAAGAPRDQRLAAYLVPSKGLTPASSELARLMLDRLPGYMVPSAFVVLDAWPLTSSGKINRRALPRPDMNRIELDSAYVAPRTPIEESLAKIWAGVLGLDQVGVYDHFFRLGGHSLLATQVMSRVRAEFQIDLPLRTLFEAPTIAGLAESLVQREMELADREQLSQMLAELEQLTDEQVQQLLTRGLNDQEGIQ